MGDKQADKRRYGKTDRQTNRQRERKTGERQIISPKAETYLFPELSVS